MSNITLKIVSLETRTSETKGKYTYAKVDILKKDGTTRENVTMMAFGAQRESVAKMLRKGRKLTLSCVFDGGVLKVLGPQRAPKAEQAAA